MILKTTVKTDYFQAECDTCGAAGPMKTARGVAIARVRDQGWTVTSRGKIKCYACQVWEAQEDIAQGKPASKTAKRCSRCGQRCPSPVTKRP